MSTAAASPARSGSVGPAHSRRGAQPDGWMAAIEPNVGTHTGGPDRHRRPRHSLHRTHGCAQWPTGDALSLPACSRTFGAWHLCSRSSSVRLGWRIDANSFEIGRSERSPSSNTTPRSCSTQPCLAAAHRVQHSVRHGMLHATCNADPDVGSTNDAPRGRALPRRSEQSQQRALQCTAARCLPSPALPCPTALELVEYTEYAHAPASGHPLCRPRSSGRSQQRTSVCARAQTAAKSADAAIGRG